MCAIFLDLLNLPNGFFWNGSLTLPEKNQTCPHLLGFAWDEFFFRFLPWQITIKTHRLGNVFANFCQPPNSRKSKLSSSHQTFQEPKMEVRNTYISHMAWGKTHPQKSLIKRFSTFILGTWNSRRLAVCWNSTHCRWLKSDLTSWGP